MNEFRADLHMHSTFSDGSLTPELLVKESKKSQLSAISITDHDTVSGLEEGRKYAEQEGLFFLSGIEFSATFQEKSVHILGYGFQVDHPEITKLCQLHRERRKERNLSIIRRLKGFGIIIDAEEFATTDQVLGRPHIAQKMVEAKIVASIQEAFQNYLGEGKKAYVRGEVIPAEKTIDVIHQANGFAIVAHPHLLPVGRWIHALFSLKFDGLEGYYAKLPLEQEKRWLEIALKKKWMVTGGSDYHGGIKPHERLGSSWVNAESFRKLYERDCQSNTMKPAFKNFSS